MAAWIRKVAVRLKKREVRRQDELHFWAGRREEAFLLGYCFGPPSRWCNSFIHREDFNRRISSNLRERGKHFLPSCLLFKAALLRRLVSAFRVSAPTAPSSGTTTSSAS